MRSGTLPATLVVGFGAAAAIAKQDLVRDETHIRQLAHRLYDGITSQMQGVVLNGPADLDGKQRYIGNLNLSFAYVEGESLLMGLKVGLADSVQTTSVISGSTMLMLSLQNSTCSDTVPPTATCRSPSPLVICGGILAGICLQMQIMLRSCRHKWALRVSLGCLTRRQACCRMHRTWLSAAAARAQAPAWSPAMC